MHSLTLIGIVLGGAVIATDHLIRRIPNWLAILLYSIAVVLCIAGMLISRQAR